MKRKSVNKVLAFFMAAALLCGLLPTSLTVSASSTKTYTFDVSNLTTTEDQEEIADGTVVDSDNTGYIKTFGTVKKRTSNDGSVKAVEIAKNQGGGFKFEVTGTAEVTISFSSNSSSNESLIGIIDGDSNLVADSNGNTQSSVTGTSSTEVSYTLEAGSYSIVSPSTQRVTRVYTITINETTDDDDSSVTTSLYELDLKGDQKGDETYEGLLVSKSPYDGGISVMEDMPYTSSNQEISGTTYSGYVVGSNNPKTNGSSAKGSVPDEGAVLILEAGLNGRLKLAVKLNQEKNYYLVDGTDSAVDYDYTPTEAEYTFLTFEVEKGHTYYFYGNGTKVNYYYIAVDYRTSEDWDAVKYPTLGTPSVDNAAGTITVPFNAQVGGLYADSLDVSMYDANGNVVDTISYTTESTSGEVTFTPTASGTYTFKAELVRSGEDAKESNTTDPVEFVLPMAAPTIVGAENAGSGNVKFSWKAVTEAESYNVYVDNAKYDSTTELSITITGLTIGTTYTFGVTAVRGDDESEMATTSLAVTEEAQKTWYYAAFGSGADTKNNGYSGSVDDNDLKLWSTNSKGKLVPASTDGLAYYYTIMDPETENFTLEADVAVESWTYTNGQEGFGLMVADAVGTDGDSSSFWNNSYMASVTKVEYYWDTDAQAVSDAGTKYTMKLGIGSQEKIGVTSENIAEGTSVNYLSSKMTTLETTAAKAGLATGTYNIVGNYTNDNEIDLGDIEPTLTTFHLTVQRNNTGYFISYTDESGTTVTNKYYHGDDGDELTKIDENNIYAGFFAARTATIAITNVSLTTISPEDDDPAEERPITYVTPNYTVESATVANSSAYELVYYGNADGTLTITAQDGTVIADGVTVEANTKYRFDTTIEKGTNTFTVTFTPDPDYCPSEYERLSDYSTKTFEHTVTYQTIDQCIIYASPDGTSTGAATQDDPVDIYTAVTIVEPGETIVLMEGTYYLDKTVTVERGMDGTADALIYMIADPEAETRPVLDFQSKCAGMVLAGDYWYFQGFDVTKSSDGQKGIQVSGNYNTLDSIYTYRNGNTGIQLSRYKSTDEWEDWPSYNLILNCTSYLNADAGYEDADGFAAKLTVADGNVFDGCISAYNADDGWDLYAKVETGPIGVVTIKNSLSFKNGYDIDADGNEVIAGNGNGFKMGGSSIEGAHILTNSIAFGNRSKGFDSNSGPDIQVYNSISFNNESYNVALYTNDAKTTNFVADGIISYKNAAGNTTAENLKPLSGENLYSVYNYYFSGTQSENAEGTVVSDDWFESVDMDTAINGGITRNSDGTINLNGFLELTTSADAAYTAYVLGASSGSILGATASAEITPAHVYGDPVFSWSDDYSECTVTFTCTVCGETVTVTAVVTSETTDSTCNEDGATVYTATAEFNGETYTDEVTVAINATGHTYGEPEYVWSDDYSQCTLVFTCEEGDDTQMVAGTVTSVTVEATDTEDGSIVYTVTAEFNGQTYTSTVTVVIPATGTSDNPAPDTGDSGISAYVILLLVCGALIAALSIGRRRYIR